MSLFASTQPASSSRRRLLRGGVAIGGAASLLALPTGLAARARLASSDAIPQATSFGALLVLDQHRAIILESFADATLATGNGFPSTREATVVRRIDEELSFTDPAIRDDFLLAIDAIDYLPLLYARFSRLHRMVPAERREFLEGLATTRLDTVRAMVNGLRMVTGLVYYAHRASWAAMDYEGTHAGLPPRDSEQRAHYRQQTGGRA